MYGETRYQIIQCSGCDKITFREKELCSEDIDQFTGEAIERVSLYPTVSKDDLECKPYWEVPNKIRQIYEETIRSYNSSNHILCAAGLRAIIEGICAEKGIHDGEVIINNTTHKTARKSNLEGKICGLNENELVTKSHSDILHQHRFLGNKALHELDIPSKEELKLAINILEHTLENIYELKYQSEELKWKGELRRKKN